MSNKEPEETIEWQEASTGLLHHYYQMYGIFFVAVDFWLESSL